MAAHGFPRATMDIDIRVNPTPDNAKRVYLALKAFGTPMDQISADDLADSGLIFQIGVTPRRIDILTSISGVAFNEAITESSTIDIDGYSVNVLSGRHLIKNKKATGRAKDILDVETLSSKYIE